MAEGKGIKAALSQQQPKASQQVGDDADLEGYEYRVILHGGLVIQVISKQPAGELSVAWQQARKADAVIAWNADQFTEARQVAHIESVIEEDEEEGDEEPAAEATETSVPVEKAVAS